MDTLLTILKQQGMWGAVLATITFVLIGFFATKTGLFTKEINGKLSKFTLTYALPFLCVGAFMQNANAAIAKEVGIVLGLSVAFYLFAILWNWMVIKFWPQMVKKSVTARAEKIYEESDKTKTVEQCRDAYVNSLKQKIMTSQMMLAYGSLQFFAYPLLIAMAGGEVFDKFSLALAQTWCIPYMIGAFAYVKLGYSGQKFDKSQIKPIMKSLFSPMMICLYVSLILWAIQFIPGCDSWFYFDKAAYRPYTKAVFDPISSAYYTDATLATKVAGPVGQFWGGFKANLPVFGNIITMATGIVSPLAWLVIGGSLATSNIKEAAKDKDVWVTTIRKLVILPLVIFALGFLFVPFKILSPSTATILVLLAATPPAAVTMIFSVAYNHEWTGYTAQVSALSTLLCLITIPIWIVIASVSYKLVAKA